MDIENENEAFDINVMTEAEREAFDINNGMEFIQKRISFKETVEKNIKTNTALVRKAGIIEKVRKEAARFLSDTVDFVVPAQFNQPSYAIKTINPVDLVISKVTQRDIKWDDVAKRIGDEYTGSATQHITVVINNEIEDIKGKYFIVDGQHTASIRYIQGIPLVCNVIFSNETHPLKFSKDIGELFRKLNNRKKVSGWDLGKAKAIAGDQDWKKIVDLFTEYEKTDGGNSPKEKGEMSRLTTFKKCYDTFGGSDDIKSVLQFSKVALNNDAMSGMIFASLVTLFYECKRANVTFDQIHLSSIFRQVDPVTGKRIISRKLDKMIQKRARDLSINTESIYNSQFGFKSFSNHTHNFITGRVYAIIDMYNETAEKNGVPKITPFKLSKDQYSL